MQSHMVEEGRLRASLATAHEPRTPSGAQEGAGSMESEWKASLVSPRAGLYSRMKKGNAGSPEDGDFFASFFSDFFPLPLLLFDHVLFACAPLSWRHVYAHARSTCRRGLQRRRESALSADITFSGKPEAMIHLS